MPYASSGSNRRKRRRTAAKLISADICTLTYELFSLNIIH
jgi:hypothetical protein